MMFMNEYEIDFAVEHHASHPVLAKATKLLAAYRDEINRNSDGWPYWSIAVKAAAKLMVLIQSGNATDADLRRAGVPIKAFCTRHKLTFPTV
jgi:hypothetical protein